MIIKINKNYSMSQVFFSFVIVVELDCKDYKPVPADIDYKVVLVGIDPDSKIDFDN